MSELQPEYNWGSLYSQRQGHLAEVNNMTCAEALIWYHEHSYHVRPVEVTPDGNRKLALLNPGYHFAELPWPTDAEIGWLLQNWNAAWQLGMIVAWDSSYLWALDVDDLGQWERFQAEYNIIPTASQITGRDRGGMTLLYQRDPTNTEEDDRESLRQGPWSGKYRNLEVKSNGSVVVAPSVHHKTGRKYQWMADGPGYPEEASSTMLARRGDIVQAALIEVAAREKLMDRAARRRADELEQETTLADVPERPGQVLADFLADTPQEVQFEIPGLVPKQSRVIITGEEGVGKSTLSRYIGFCHAAGIHPFTAEPYGGGITVMIDCENAKSLNQMRLAELAESVGRGEGPPAAGGGLPDRRHRPGQPLVAGVPAADGGRLEGHHAGDRPALQAVRRPRTEERRVLHRHLAVPGQAARARLLSVDRGALPSGITRLRPGRRSLRQQRLAAVAGTGHAPGPLRGAERLTRQPLCRPGLLAGAACQGARLAGAVAG
jgi:Bifunctional DNA primase/polymerase, N-terminal/AAA domain